MQRTDQAIKQAAETAILELENKFSQTYNELWPWLIVLGLLASIFLIGCFGLLYYWIKSNSYMKQKPVYERVKNGNYASSP